MTVGYKVILICDYPQCHTKAPASVTTFGSASARHEVRDLAAEKGWVVAHDHRGGRYDLCPTHAEEQPGRTFKDRT